MRTRSLGALAASLTGAALIYAGAPTTAAAALVLDDLQFWVGAGNSRAAVVIDWNDGSPGLAWGYRWDGAKTGQEMLAAIVAADSRLTVSGLSSGFVSNIGFDADLNGTVDRFRPGYNASTGEYWGYWVNNDVYYHPTDFGLNSHIVPPSLVVVPLGDPFAAVNPGAWVSSSTGVGGRELVNGSWDGFGYNSGSSGPTAPVPVAPIPEPGLFCLSGLVLVFLRHRQSRRAAACACAGLMALPEIACAQGTYPPAAGQPGSNAVAATSPAIKGWATGFTNLARGREYKLDNLSPLTTYGAGASALGVANAAVDYPYDDPNAPAPVVSLGDGGSITLTFSPGIANGPGADFAVFENGFTATFLELAHVEVSSNGTDFFRFPSVSLTQTTTQMQNWNGISAVNIHNLAGKYIAAQGTPFDLDELKTLSPLLNVSRVTHVRIVDVVGSISGAVGSRDSLENLINDPFPTEFETGGFDLDAVGVMNLYQVPPFEIWRSAQFTPAQLSQPSVSGIDADPDKNGLANFAEYALGRLPLAATGGEPLKIRVEASEVVLNFARFAAKSDVRYEVMGSSATSGWSRLAVSEAGAATTTSVPGGLIEEAGANPTMVTLRLPRTSGRANFRLAFTQL